MMKASSKFKNTYLMCSWKRLGHMLENYPDTRAHTHTHVHTGAHTTHMHACMHAPTTPQPNFRLVSTSFETQRNLKEVMCEGGQYISYYKHWLLTSQNMRDCSNGAHNHFIMNNNNCIGNNLKRKLIAAVVRFSRMYSQSMIQFL